MNEPQIVALPSEPTELSQPDISIPQSPGSENRGNGKVARLPKATRDQINHWLLDGLSYPDIITRLGDQGKELKPAHLHEYKKRRYQKWLLQQEYFEDLNSQAEFSQGVMAVQHSTTLHEAGLRLAAAQMLDQLMRFKAALNHEDAQPDPDQFVRLTNALSRLAREALTFQKYHDTRAKNPEVEHPRDPQKPASAEHSSGDINRFGLRTTPRCGSVSPIH